MSEDKGFQEKVKKFIKNFKKSSPNPQLKSKEFLGLPADIQNELKSHNSICTRLQVINEISEIALVVQFEAFAIETLWVLLKDLLKPEIPHEVRHRIISFFTSLCETQVVESSYLRDIFFQFIKSHNNVMDKDAMPKFEFLKTLTHNGKDVSYLEDKIGPFLLSWMGELHNPCPSDSDSDHGRFKTEDFIAYLNNFIVFNHNSLDQQVLAGFIQNICFIACASSLQEERSQCISFLETVVSNTNVPPSSLVSLVATLCRIMNLENLCDASWKTMKCLLQKQFGYSCLYTMCEFMSTAEYSVIRGAVYFVGVSLWGSHMVRSLKCSPTAILLSFQKALEGNNIYIASEVMLRIQDLVTCNGSTLQCIACDLVVEIIKTVVEDINGNYDWKKNQHHHSIVKTVNNILDTIENIVESGGFSGLLNKFYKVVEDGISFRSETSIKKLLTYKQSFLHPIVPYWLNNLIQFTEKHYRDEHRPGLKIHAIKIIQRICLLQMHIYEDELIEKVVLHSAFETLDKEPHIQVRQCGIRFLIQVALESTSSKCQYILVVLERILQRICKSSQKNSAPLHECDIEDITEAINGIIQIFQKKIHQLPSCVAVDCCRILVCHLRDHYKQIKVLDNCEAIRFSIFNCFFKIQTNSLYHLGFPFAGSNGVVKMRFSPYVNLGRHLHVENNEESNENSSSDDSDLTMTRLTNRPSYSKTLNSNCSPAFVTPISLAPIFKQVINALKNEKDWRVMELILKQLPHVFEARTLIISKNENDFNRLASILCRMVIDNSTDYVELLRNRPSNFSPMDLQTFVFPIISFFASQTAYLKPFVKLLLLKCLRIGLNSRFSAIFNICIHSLSMCAMAKEMEETMLSNEIMPKVVTQLSNTKVTETNSIPILEFLSTIIHLPRILMLFQRDHYMAVFNIVLPLMDPFKFNHFTVTLAHQMIASWFIKCPVSSRRSLVSTIKKGLEGNIWAPFEEEIRRGGQELLVSDDSHNTQRRSSFSTRIFMKKRRFNSGNANATPDAKKVASNSEIKNPILDKHLMKFHFDLKETCIDFMARYAFADYSALPTRFQATNFLLNGGDSQSWLVQNSIITITTSGCTQKELKDGLCDKCWIFCKKSLNCTTEDVKGKIKINSHVSFTSKAGDNTIHPRGDDGSINPKLNYHPSFQEAINFTSEHTTCLCWCKGWAEIHVRKPTGNASWIMRVQNQHANHSLVELSIKELAAMYLPAMFLVRSFNIQDYATDSSILKPKLVNKEQNKSLFPTRRIHPLSPRLINPENQNSEEKAKPMKEIKNLLKPKRLSLTTTSLNKDSSLKLSASPRNFLRRSHSSPEISQCEKLQQKEVPVNSKQESILIRTKQDLIVSSKVDQVFVRKNGLDKHCGNQKVAESVLMTREEVESVNKHCTNLVKERGTLESTLSATEEFSSVPRGRLSTISVMSPAKPNRFKNLRRIKSLEPNTNKNSNNDNGNSDFSSPSGISPGFVFLQLCSQGIFGFGNASQTILFPSNDQTENTIKTFDIIPPYETHKIGVVYIGQNQINNEQLILQNQYGSSRYLYFLRGLGKRINLRAVDPHTTFLGGLSQDGEDGNFATTWHDDVMKVIFHVLTLLPNRKDDSFGNAKKRHIDNDFVVIAYNESGKEYDISTVQGPFLYVYVIIEPMDDKRNRVSVKAKPILAGQIGHSEPIIVSDHNLPMVVRQLAIHSNLACVVFQSKQHNESGLYASNWLERLRYIKMLRKRMTQECEGSRQKGGTKTGVKMGAHGASLIAEDFTKFV